MSTRIVSPSPLPLSCLGDALSFTNDDDDVIHSVPAPTTSSVKMSVVVK
jgi:hypothetical protein